LDPQTLGSFSRLELAIREIEQLGLHLTCLPGEYCVNYHHGSEATARFAETLEAALSAAHSMIDNAPAETEKASAPCRPHLLTAKAIRRCKILSHNHRARAIWLKKYLKRI
jgi:hypothetical protein